MNPGLWRAIPLQMAPIPCSRTPKRTLRSSGVFFWKSPNIFIKVMFEDARSALPPITPGRTGANALSIVCERFLVESPGVSGVYVYRNKIIIQILY
ncbi:hypothetical protein Hanom_Chr04g00371151 [Helianthus anomalus]